MTAGRITKRSGDAFACAPGKDREFLWDHAVSGFGVAAFPSGKKAGRPLQARHHRRAWPVDTLTKRAQKQSNCLAL